MVANVSVLSNLNHTNGALAEAQNITIETKTELSEKTETLKQLEAEKLEISNSYKEEQSKVESLNGENQTLKANLQAKKEAEAKVAQVVIKKPSVATPVAQVSGSKADWLASSGIPSDQWSYVDQIVGRESGWNPNAVNKSSGACGLGQQLPCGKWAGAWNDPVAALSAMNGYVTGRYGSWAGAVAFWNANHWY